MYKEFLSAWSKTSRGALLAFGVLCAVLSVASCTTAPSEPFTPAENPAPGQTLIYLYRPFLAGGVGINDITLSANGKPVVSLPYNTYYPYLTNPGEIQFTGRFQRGAPASLTLYVKGGQTYFIRAKIRVGPFQNEVMLALVEQSTGEEEVRVCSKVDEKNVVH